jgi:hypothetical protein
MRANLDHTLDTGIDQARHNVVRFILRCNHTVIVHDRTPALFSVGVVNVSKSLCHRSSVLRVVSGSPRSRLAVNQSAKLHPTPHDFRTPIGDVPRP